MTTTRRYEITKRYTDSDKMFSNTSLAPNTSLASAITEFERQREYYALRNLSIDTEAFAWFCSCGKRGEWWHVDAGDDRDQVLTAVQAEGNAHVDKESQS